MIEGAERDKAPEGAPRAVVYVINIDPKDCDRLVKRVHDLGKHELKNIPGFMEARLLVSDDSTRIIVETLWESRHDWSHSRWDEEVQRLWSDIFTVAKDIDLKFYGRREIIA